MSASEPPEKLVAETCTVCGSDIYAGEVYGLGPEGLVLCADCLEDTWRGLGLCERFEALGCVPARDGLPL